MSKASDLLERFAELSRKMDEIESMSKAAFRDVQAHYRNAQRILHGIQNVSPAKLELAAKKR